MNLPEVITKTKHRCEFPVMLTALGLTGVGAEIGVSGGNYSYKILAESQLSHLFSVDLWKVGSAEYSQLQYLKACNKLAEFRTRVSLIRQPSPEAASIFNNNYFDFIYIDAGHTYKAVTNDIAAWWPKLKPGGIFAGHDYWLGKPKGNNNGVQEAVVEFITTNGLPLHTTNDYPHIKNGSWITQKPQ